MTNVATLMEQRAVALKAAQEIVDGAKAAARDLGKDEAEKVESYFTEIKTLDGQIDASRKSQDLISRLAAAATPTELEEAAKSDLNRAGSMGQAFVESSAFKAFRGNHPAGVGGGTPVHIEAKGLGSVVDLGIGTKATITTETGYPGATREPGGYFNYLPGDEPLTFLNLVTTGNTNVSYAEYARIISETNNAAVVLEGDPKPLSDVTTDVQESKAFTYADGFDITNQTLADDGALAALMEARIRQHVRGVVEDKLLNGVGTGTEPLGILETSGTLSQAFDEDVVVTIARSLEAFETANKNQAPQAIVMNPRDVWNLRLLKDNTGNYLLGNPLQQGLIPTPFGVPLVRSNAVGQGQALVGRFDSVHYLEMEPLSVVAFNQHKDYAQRNMVYVRAETRGRQLFYAPREVVIATIGNGDSSSSNGGDSSSSSSD